MDIQLKRGLLDVCVLAAIKSNESYGYQIIKDMSNEEFIGELISRIDQALAHYETHKGADFFEQLAEGWT